MRHSPIVFTRFTGDGKEMYNDLYAVDPDGKNETRLTMNPGQNGKYADNAAPRYNRDKTLIAFVSTRNHERSLYNIFLMDLAARKTAQITNGDLNITSVDWSPDDSRLVFAGIDEKGLQQVHTVKMDGTEFTRLTAGPSEHMNPLWSPAGGLIACVRFEPGSKSSHIVVMDPAGREQRQLTTDDTLHANPSWSPDGEWLVYRCDLGTPHLRRLHVGTGELVVFERPERGGDSSPVWSGNEIVFSSSREWEDADAIASLYRMSDTGEIIQRLTGTQAYDYCGDW